MSVFAVLALIHSCSLGVRPGAWALPRMGYAKSSANGHAIRRAARQASLLTPKCEIGGGSGLGLMQAKKACKGSGIAFSFGCAAFVHDPAAFHDVDAIGHGERAVEVLLHKQDA